MCRLFNSIYLTFEKYQLSDTAIMPLLVNMWVLSVYGVTGAFTICSFFRAATMDPGRVLKYMEDMALDGQSA